MKKAEWEKIQTMLKGLFLEPDKVKIEANSRCLSGFIVWTNKDVPIFQYIAYFDRDYSNYEHPTVRVIITGHTFKVLKKYLRPNAIDMAKLLGFRICGEEEAYE